jgi:hypothetical protein
MPDELSLAVVGASFDNAGRRGKPKGSRQIDPCCASLAA